MSANVNSETGISYGVISGNAAHWLYEEITTNGTDTTFEAYKRQLVKEMAALLEEHGQHNAEDTATGIVDSYEWDDYQCDESDYEYTDSSGNEFLLSYLGGTPLIWCIKTSVIVHARPCSPCVPGAGDLDSPDENGIQCYGIPSEYLDDVTDDDDDDTAADHSTEPFDGAAGDGPILLPAPAPTPTPKAMRPMKLRRDGRA